MIPKGIIVGAGLFYHLVMVSMLILAMSAGLALIRSTSSHQASLEDRVYLLEFQQGLLHNPTQDQIERVKGCDAMIHRILNNEFPSSDNYSEYDSRNPCYGIPYRDLLHQQKGY